MPTDPSKSDAIFHALVQNDYGNLDKSTKPEPKTIKSNESVAKPITLPTASPRSMKPLNEYNDPEKSSDPDEQIQLIAEGLSHKISNGNSIGAIMFARDWIDGIVDGDGSLYEPVKEELLTLSKNDLVKFIGGILATIK